MSKISTINQVKNHNVALVRNTLRTLESGTKHSIAQITGLSIATCNTILNDLALTGEIIPVESEAPSIGRPPKSYKFNKDYSYICCIYPIAESGKKFLNYAVVDLLGNIISQRSFSYETIGYDEIAGLVGDLLEKEPRIQIISLGIPGYYSDGQVESCGVEELNGCALVERLQNQFQKPVLIENNMNAIAYGFYSNGAEYVESAESFIMISFFKNSGPGSGIILNGNIISGCTNFAGEILYLPYPNGEIHELIEKGRENIIDCAALALKCYCAILNPAVVIFTGENISPDMIAPIQNKCMETIPQNHIPQLRYEKNYMDSYIKGLSQIALNEIFVY